MKTRRTLLALLAPLAFAACAAPAYVSPVEVTRFVGPEASLPLSGPIALAPAPDMTEAEASSLETSIFRNALAQELERLGFTITPDAPVTAFFGASQAVKQAGRGHRSPVSVGGGASTGSYGSGIGIGVGINLNSLAGPPPDEIDSALVVTFRPTGGGMSLWEGRALMTATTNSDYAQTQAAAARVAAALFDGFPGNDGETIEVK